MNKIIVCIKDTKSGFINPTPVINEEVAIRQYKTILKDKNTEIAMFPEDYELWKVADFNTITGEITPELKFIYNAVKGGE